MTSIDQILPYFELLNYLSTVGLLIVAIIGLKQLTLSKQLSQIDATRDSYKLANEQVKYYLEKIIPSINKLNDIVKSNNIAIFKESTFKFVNSRIKTEIKPKNENTIKEIGIIAGPLVEVLNLMEVFASFFISKAADEGIAFRTVGKTFCETFEDYIPLARHLEGEGYYKNSFELYFIWKERLDAQILLNEKQRIEEKLNTLKVKTIEPIGTTK